MIRTESWPELLVDDLARRRAVLFLGAGVSRNSQGSNGERPPLWVELLERAAQRCSKPTKHIHALIKRGELLAACELIQAKMAEEFGPFLADTFTKPRYRHAEVHAALFDLDLRIVATPNFDKIYETYAQTTSQNGVLVKNYYDDDIGNATRGDQRVIIRVHGCVDNQSKLVFSRREYSRARYEHGSFFELLDALVLTHTFLFVGCSLADPDVQLMLGRHAYRFRGARPHYMLAPRGSLHQEELKSHLENFNIRFILYDPKDNHHQLTKRIQDLVQLVEEKRKVLADRQDW